MLAQLTPPLLKNWVSRKKTARKLYPSYKAAQIACLSSGYDEMTLINAYRAKTENYSQFLKKNSVTNLSVSQLFLLNCLNSFNKNKIVVLDLGGGFGGHYYLMKKLLPEVDLEWVIAEHPKVSSIAPKDRSIDFVDSNELSHLKENIDLVFTSATLQHVEAPLELIEQMLRLNSSYFAFLRLGLSLTQSIYTIHKAKMSDCGPGELPENITDTVVDFPFHFIAKNDFLNAVKDLSLKLSCEDNTGLLPLSGVPLEGSNLLYTRAIF